MLAINCQEKEPQQAQSQVGERGQGRDAVFFRRRNIFKLYQFIRENQRM
jgi:hypothetical protein